MIKVNKKFYESGCTMEGRGNRLILKGKNGEGTLQMIFKGSMVEILNGYEDRRVPFDKVEEICVSNAKPIKAGPFPAIQLK